MHLTVIKNESCEIGYRILCDRLFNEMDNDCSFSGGFYKDENYEWCLKITYPYDHVVLSFMQQAENLDCKYRLERNGIALHKEEVKDLLNQLDSGGY